jgi:hypothetical protein
MTGWQRAFDAVQHGELRAPSLHPADTAMRLSQPEFLFLAMQERWPYQHPEIRLL